MDIVKRGSTCRSTEKTHYSVGQELCIVIRLTVGEREAVDNLSPLLGEILRTCNANVVGKN